MLISFVNVGGLGLTQPVAALDANAVHGLKMIRDGLDGRTLTHGRGEISGTHRVVPTRGAERGHARRRVGCVIERKLNER